MQKTILVTGSTGVLGENLIKFLLARNKYKIIAVYHNKEPRIFNKNVFYLRADLCSKRIFEHFLDKNHVDCVIHCAALKQGSKWDLFRVNTLGTASMVTVFRSKVKQFIYISTSFIGAIKNAYTLSKEEGESIVKNSGMTYTILRLPHLYTRSRGIFNSKSFITTYRIIRILFGVKFAKPVMSVEDACIEIESAILNRRKYNLSI